MPHGVLKRLNFQMFYDANGNDYSSSKKARVEQVQIYRDGTMYDVPFQIGD
jgi:hypothetical protein